MVHLESQFSLSSVLSAETQNQLWFQKGIHHVLDHLRSIQGYQDRKGNILNVPC